jgi:hypothetical protein
VTSVNALQFAGDTLGAVAELARVVEPGGYIAISNWAEADRNDLDTIKDAVGRATGAKPCPDGDLRLPGGLERLLAAGHLAVVTAGIIEVPWVAQDDRSLVRSVLFGEDPVSIVAQSSTVIAAARPFRTPTGGYRLVNAFRYAVGRTTRSTPCV